MVDTLSGEDDPKAKQTGRERDAKQLVQRIISLTTTTARLDAALVPPDVVGERSGRESFEYRDIALLFRAMTDVPVYEAEFRRAGIPFQTVLGKGFYEREEIRDLIQLCRFLDNRTDELALAAVLRSPLCGISDNTLLALRLGPRTGETAAGETPQPRKHPRPLFYALRKQREIDFIDENERQALERAFELLASLIERRHRYPIGDLLRFAVEQSSYTTVIAATYDGAQRLANIEKLFNLAQRFERSGAHLIRDFVKYVHDFEAIGSRESEGQLDDSANAVKLMTIHQAKGLEFPVVIIPDLHRLRPSWEGYFLLDRHRGLTLKVPNGRGQMVSGRTFTLFSERAQWRENFESMRLLYVAATRAEDRLILSGATKEISRLAKGDDSWLQLIWQALELGPRWQSSLVELDHENQLQLTVNLVDQEGETAGTETTDKQAQAMVLSPQLSESFPLLRPIEPERDASVHRLSVTQLINYQRCPRQYYFDRVLHVPTPDQMAVWNDAEAPEPPANLTATLKGAVIHRFCETYSSGDNSEDLLRRSFEEVVRTRQAELADRLVEINRDEAIADLLPLAQNYLSSAVFERVERARAGLSAPPALRGGLAPGAAGGLWSELSFRLRRPLGILTGAIDKLLITQSINGFEVEVIDFKTNRIRGEKSGGRKQEAGGSGQEAAHRRHETGMDARRSSGQFAFDFEAPVVSTSFTLKQTEISLDEQVLITASDYQLQMQAYALAVAELIDSLVPGLRQAGFSIKSTLHFLEPNVEFHLSGDLLAPDACARAIDNAMIDIISSIEPRQFPVRPAMHCRMCNFLGICPAGRDWVRSAKPATTDDLSMAAMAIQNRAR